MVCYAMAAASCKCLASVCTLPASLQHNQAGQNPDRGQMDYLIILSSMVIYMLHITICPCSCVTLLARTSGMCKSTVPEYMQPADLIWRQSASDDGTWHCTHQMLFSNATQPCLQSGFPYLGLLYSGFWHTTDTALIKIIIIERYASKC